DDRLLENEPMVHLRGKTRRVRPKEPELVHDVPGVSAPTPEPPETKATLFESPLCGDTRSDGLPKKARIPARSLPCERLGYQKPQDCWDPPDLSDLPDPKDPVPN